ncbi:GAF and ANTAR domain-containing protein [Streptomyces sp. MST-110588]|uniref:GAF and ANTAR domain-containing protein n=1 Tax=Streptomyces sp. MST-110588 TaxID=2833628 RepID=UPI001F5D2B89|nr:GAF and ANTAR domain-containing protein [Streptomyces sp. MST-110588]UNO41037.1 GAF and ANTAR domain-containing protein [Streptomyces sp. MST-110588]
MDDDRHHAAAWRHLSETARAAGTGVTLATACQATAVDIDVDALGVTLVTVGELRVLGCASNEQAELLENAQLVTGEGPCTDAFLQHALIEEADLNLAPSRWPAFSQVAAELGIRSVTALPLAVGDLRVGALDLYRLQARSLNGQEKARARAYARILALLVLDEHPHFLAADARSARPGPQGYPPAVHAAAGILAAKDNLTPDDALARMRAHSYRYNQPLQETAENVINGRALDDDRDD